ncbi:MAG: hypothetical protein WD793_00325 [Steroidobacteraceae bacterium]
MKIDVTNGSIVFAKGTISAGQLRPDFLRSSLGQISNQRVMGGNWTHQDLEPEKGIHCSASFDDDRLDHVFILMNHPSDEADKLNEAIELERKALHDAWLLKELGPPPYEYAWGKVVSDYDNRGCVSEIIIRYGSLMEPRQWWQEQQSP